jgi:predicted unusual protein kinase regulating ubiquinone biosynthesis (AarF/ABC1/UbiB family)
MVFSVFDCIDRDPRWSGNPFDKNHKLNDNAVLAFPEDLMYVMRAIQIMRGMATALGQEFSIAKVWAPMAQQYLDREKDQERIKQLEERKEVDLRRGVVI